MAVINTATIVIRDDKRACGRAIKIGMCGIAGVVKKAGEREQCQRGVPETHIMDTHTCNGTPRHLGDRGRSGERKREREEEEEEEGK